MSKQIVTEGGKARYAPSSEATEFVDLLSEPVFDRPPSMRVGALTSVFGAFAGGISLLLFARLWQPYHFLSAEWLIFVSIGAVAGFYLRIERAFTAKPHHSVNSRPHAPRRIDCC
jgi:hypothetical protein